MAVAADGTLARVQPYVGMSEPHDLPRHWLRIWRSQHHYPKADLPGTPIMLEAGDAPSILPPDDPDWLPGHGRYGEAY